MGRKPNPLVVCLVDRFLVAEKTTLTAGTWNFYRMYLRAFVKSWGHLPVSGVTPSLAAEWVAKHYGKCSPSAQFNAARSLTRLFHWAETERLITFYPLRGFRKPTPTRRELTITPRQYAALLKACSNQSILDAIKFLYHSGARPQEMRKIRAEWVQGRKIVLPIAESKGKRRNRIVYLDDAAHRLITRRAGRGLVFLSPTGRPWTKNNLIVAIHVLRERAGVPGICAYTFRHSFITRQLEKGTNVATVAALAGNSPATVWKHYCHVADNERRLLAAL